MDSYDYAPLGDPDETGERAARYIADDAPNREPSTRPWITKTHRCSVDCFTLAELRADPTIEPHYAAPHICFDHDGMSGDCEAAR